MRAADEYNRQDQPSRDRDRSENYDDSRILQNVIAEIPSGRRNNNTNSKAHSLDSFRPEPERLDDPPSSSLKSASSSQVDLSINLLKGDISKIDYYNQPIKQRSINTLMSWDDLKAVENSSTDEMNDIIFDGTQMPKKSKSKRKLLAQSLRVKSMELFGIDGKNFKVIDETGGRRNLAQGIPLQHNPLSHKEKTEDRNLFVSDERREDSPQHSVNLKEYN